MSWIITGAEKNPVDLYRSNVSLLLHGNGTNGSTTITDSSPSPKTVTAFGNAQISTAQSKFGGASIALDGTGDYLNTSAGSINQRTEPFTIESWAWISTRTNFVLLSTTTFYWQEVGGIVYFGDSGANPIQISSSELPLSDWFHVAISFDATTYRIFIGGVQKGITTTLLSNNVLGSISIGARGSSVLTGYLDDFRITKGVARYTSNFTPPTAPFPDV